MAETPSANGLNGRGANGRFARGNPGGPGNPHAQHVSRLRAALFRAVKPKDLREVIAALLAKAKNGDVAAARELVQRLLGPPVEVDFTERLESLERTIAQKEQQYGRGFRPGSVSVGWGPVPDEERTDL